MDLEYLRWLQEFRGSIDDALTPLMEFVSMFSVTYLIAIPVFIYWFGSKRKGLYALVSFYICITLNVLIKLTACVYRPWIRDAEIVPAGDAITTATSYSFPSGHTATCVPLAGGTAAMFWKDMRTRSLSVIMFVYILLTAFSRNYLGVHTPQDVFVAIVLGVLCLAVTAKLFEYLEKNPEKEKWFLLGGFVFCWLGIVYISFKPYPMDYTADGTLLVDPQKMMNDGYGDIGVAIGFIIGRAVEKRFIRFEPLKKSWISAVICFLGLMPMAAMAQFLEPMMKEYLGSHWGMLLFSVVLAFYYIAFFPLIIKLCGAISERKRRAPELAQSKEG